MLAALSSGIPAVSSCSSQCVDSHLALEKQCRISGVQCFLQSHPFQAVGGGRGTPCTVQIAATLPLCADMHTLSFRKRRNRTVVCWQWKNDRVLESYHLQQAWSSDRRRAICSLVETKKSSVSVILPKRRYGWTVGSSQGTRVSFQGGATSTSRAIAGGCPSPPLPPPHPSSSSSFSSSIARMHHQFRLPILPRAVNAQRPTAANEEAAVSIGPGGDNNDEDDGVDAMSATAHSILPLHPSVLSEPNEWTPMGSHTDKLAVSPLSGPGDGREGGNPWMMMMTGGGPMPDSSLHIPREAGSMTYQAARRLLGSLADTMEALEEGLIKREQELALTATQIEDILLQGPSSTGERVGVEEGLESRGRDTSSELREAESRIWKLGAHVAALQRTVETKDEAVASLLRENKALKQKLMEGEEASATVRKLRQEIASRDTRLAALAFDVSSTGKRTQEEKSRIQEAFQAAELRASQLMAEVAQLSKDLDLRDTLLDQMRTEAQLSSKALQMAAGAMSTAREKAITLESQLKLASDARDENRQALDATEARLREAIEKEEELQQLREELQDAQRVLGDVREENLKKDQMITHARMEVTKTTEMLELSKKSLRKAEEQIVALEAQVDKGQEALREEVEASSKALKSAARREQMLRMADAKVRELTTELSSLRAVMDAKERTLDAVREETLRNADMLMSAANTREALAEAEKQVEMLTSHMEALEREVQSRDELLEEIRSETFRSTEALKLATLIKQELNMSREREAELEQQLEEKTEIIDDLRRESVENSRTGQAEQALRAAEDKVEMLLLENETMRRGIEKRDEAINLMKEELDRSVDTLDHASEDREALMTVQRQLADVEAELAAKDVRLQLLQEELASALGISPSTIRTDDGGRKPFAAWRPNQHLQTEQTPPPSPFSQQPRSPSSSPPQRPTPGSKPQ